MLPPPKPAYLLHGVPSFFDPASSPEIGERRCGTLLTKRTSSGKRRSGREQKSFSAESLSTCQERVCPASQQRPFNQLTSGGRCIPTTAHFHVREFGQR